MKKKIPKHGIITMILLAVFVFSLTKVAHASGGTKDIINTVCCNQGALTGYANDCRTGSGDCVDHFCGDPGSTELPTTICP